jgi:hypothetical protein
MAGLFGFIFGNTPKTQVYIDDSEKVTEGVTEDISGHLTGVAKYLKSQKPIASATGVAKYLKVKEQHIPSSVAKYLARQAIVSKQKLEIEDSEEVLVTGVEKYLKTHEDRPRIKISGVAKYLANHSQQSASGVAKYMARKIIAAKNAPPAIKTSSVTLYLENRKEVLVTGVSKYMARQVLVAKRIVAETTAVVESVTTLEATTGVEKYLQARG